MFASSRKTQGQRDFGHLETWHTGAGAIVVFSSLVTRQCYPVAPSYPVPHFPYVFGGHSGGHCCVSDSSHHTVVSAMLVIATLMPLELLQELKAWSWHCVRKERGREEMRRECEASPQGV